MVFTKTIFCANEQKKTVHVLTAALNGEVVATCECGRQLKFPAGVSREEFDVMLNKHEEMNSGQVTQESIDQTIAALADTEPEMPPTP